MSLAAPEISALIKTRFNFRGTQGSYEEDLFYKGFSAISVAQNGLSAVLQAVRQ
jgi:hypothetical protein